MSLHIIDDAPLDRLNTFGVSARARRLVVLEDEADLPQALDLLAASPTRLILGAGSNLLLLDDVDGVVLQMRTQGRRCLPSHDLPQPGLTRIGLMAGECWDDAVRWTLDQGLPGLENLSMIPGSCGAAAVQNIGAYGVELADRVDSVRLVDLNTGEFTELRADECQFGYRDSVFKREQGRDWLILELRLRVGPAQEPVLGYADLAARFASLRPIAASPIAAARAIADAVRAIRASKLPDPAVLGNAGSFFKNPIVPRDVADALRGRHPDLPAHPEGALADSPVKLSAAWMIDRCGWKGHREGDAGVHAAHALVLVNHGHATGRQIGELARRIQTSVHERFGVRLEPEPVLIGSL